MECVFLECSPPALCLYANTLKTDQSRLPQSLTVVPRGCWWPCSRNRQQPPENWQSGFDRSMFLFQERAGRLVSPFPGNPAKPTSQVSVSPAFPASFPCTHGQEVCQGHSLKILLEFTPHPNQTNQLGPIPNHASLRKTAKNPGSSPQAATCSRQHIPGI